MNEKVSKYFQKQKSPQKEICGVLRQIILNTFPHVNEEIRMGVAWYGKYYIVSLKDSVNLGFSVEGLSKKDKDNFKGTGKLMRHLKFKDTKEIDEARIVMLLLLVEKKAKCE